MFERVLINTVITERREAKQDSDLLVMRVINQFPNKIVFDVFVVFVVGPRNREFFRAKPSGHPKNNGVGPIFGDAIDGIPPVSQIHHGHAHEGHPLRAQLHDRDDEVHRAKQR